MKVAYFTKVFEVKSGHVVVDLGACVGKATLYFSRKVGSKGLVVAVEPVVENYRKLIQTIITNKLSNVIPLLVAISDKTTATIMNLAEPLKDYGAHSLFFEKEYGKRGVPTISWDVLMTACGLGHVDLMKMNIEGGELRVLQSMNVVLPRRIIVSEHIRFEKNPKQVLKQIYMLLKGKGYKILAREHYYIYGERE
ncbi:hypothetical protein ES703_62478 [subsurface metagenome]